MLNSPLRTVKLKAGSISNCVDDARTVPEAAQACAETSKILQLDANRPYKPVDYIQFEQNLRARATWIAFIEKPGNDGVQLHEWLRRLKERESFGRLVIVSDEILDDQSLESIWALAPDCRR